MRVLFFLLCFLPAFQAWPLAFGQNKVRAKEFKWNILTTEHFEIYFYPEETALARRAAVLAEAAYRHTTKMMDYFPKARTPLFIFQNHIEFQQTEITQDVLTEGVGGFTEPFKNRVVLPTTGSDKWLETVIFHEFTHAVQFDILYGEGTRSFHVFKNYLIPLWMIEGMAEYNAQNWDNFAEMVLRDGVLHDRVESLEMLEGFDHLDNVYLAYKAGQSAVEYLSRRYGPEKVPWLIKKFRAQLSAESVIKEVTGKGMRGFSREWLASLRQKFWVQARGKKSAATYGIALTDDTADLLTSNNGVAWSPDGRKIAYVSTREGRERIWTMEANGRNPRVIFGGPYEGIGRAGALGVPGNRLSWSPDCKRLAFVIEDAGKKRLCVGNVADGSVQPWTLPVEDVSSPAFSPDGRFLAYAGSSHGQFEIYTLELNGAAVFQVTSGTDRSQVADPSWSPDGKTLVFSAEVERRNQLFLVDAKGGPAEQLTNSPCDSVMPSFAAGGKKILFSSDANGIYNLFEFDLSTRNFKPLTDVVGGLFCPKASPDGKKTLYVSYENECQNIYLMPSPDYAALPPAKGLKALWNPYEAAGSGPAGTRAAAAPPVPGENPILDLSPVALSYTAAALEAEGTLNTVNAASLPVKPYRLDFTPDLFFFLLGYDSLNGPVGGGYLTASDMLGEQNLTLYANFIPGYQSVAEADYMFYHGPVNLGLSAFYRLTTYPIYSVVPESVITSTFNDQDAGGSLLLQKPLTRFLRIEGGLTSEFLYRELSGQGTLDPTVEATLGNSVIHSVFASVVHDTTTYLNFEPLAGYRVNLTASFSDKILGSNRNYVIYQGEYQLFQPLPFISRDTVWSSRVFALDQTGNDRHIFYFGAGQVRGTSYGEFLCEKMAVANFELRRPYLQQIDHSLWPLDFLLIKDAHLALFYDVGVGPNNWEDLGPSDVRCSYGGGLRLHTFILEKALVTWSFDIAQRLDKYANTAFYLTLGSMF